ncbi:MAG TPA: VWA domain-containing protein [Candidatus Didemnitutus sp.]|jgi:Ca-activated chloride channel family protein
MRFHAPYFLWLLLPLILLFSWELARHTTMVAQRWPKISRAWAGAFNVSLGTRHTTVETRPRIWLWVGLVLGVVAFARPQWGVSEEQVFDQAREVLLAVDLSKSMLAQDVKPSRLERSKLLISSLLDGLQGERVGLVLFSGTAFLQSPLSSDYEILREMLPSLNPDYLPEGGTNYQALLDTSMQAFGTSAADRYLIILSDGEATDDDWKPMVDALKTKGIRVIGLGVGTAQGSFIPEPDGSLVKDERGAVVLSRLESGTLQELAQVTGGAYADASGWIDLPGLLRQTVDAGKKGEFSDKNTSRLVERFQWFLGPALLFLLVSFWAEFPIRPRERALPLGRSAAVPPLVSRAAGWLIAIGVVAAAFAARPLRAEDNPKETFAAPLAAAVTRLAGQDSIDAKDCAELAQTTVTYGQRLREAQQSAPAGVIRDGLAAVDRGEQLDGHAADWPALRRQLQELQQKPPEKKQDQQKKDQQNKNDQQKQQQPGQQNQPQKQSSDNSPPNQDKNRHENSDQDQQQKPQPRPQNSGAESKNQKPFGDMKGSQTPPPNLSGTQKVGGQKETKPDYQMNPELALPLQKLEQVKDQDSPAELQQLMRGTPEQPVKKGKDW